MRKVVHALACGAMLASLPAAAIEFKVGQADARLDTTLSYGATWRVSDRDSALIGFANGGTGASNNGDNGNLNFDRGLVSSAAKFTSDLDIRGKSLSLFVRVTGFYDLVNEDETLDFIPLTGAAKEKVGSDLDVLDAYLTWNFEAGDTVGQLRFGDHVLSWGESTFIQNSINTINPVDVARLRVPGSELKEALLPVRMISGSVSPTPNLTVEGFYQLKWKETEPEPSGSYFSTNDFATIGGGTPGARVMLGFGAFSEFGTSMDALLGGAPTRMFMNSKLAAAMLPSLPSFDSTWFSVPRGADRKAKDAGQFGFAVRYFAENLNNTEFGLYYIRYHSRLPLISGRTADPTSTLVAAGTVGVLASNGVPLSSALGFGISRYAQGARYIIEYPEDIQLLGFSFNTTVGTWALQGEVSHRRDVPLQIDDVEVLFQTLLPLDSALAMSPCGGATPFVVNQLLALRGCPGFSEDVTGYIRRNVTQVQATATKILGPVLGANSGAFLVEAAVTHVHNMPSQSVLRLEAPGTFTSGNPFHSIPGVGAHGGLAATSSDHFPTATSWGYRVAIRLDYNNAFQGVNISPRIVFAHDVNGITPGPGGNFIEGRKAITLGVKATYLNKWEADVGWTNFFGAGAYNLVNDRDFVAATIKYSF